MALSPQLATTTIRRAHKVHSQFGKARRPWSAGFLFANSLLPVVQAVRAKHVRSKRGHRASKLSKVWGGGAIGWPVLGLLTAAFLLGGGGSRYGLLNLSIQLMALALLVWAVHDAISCWRARPFGLRALICATLTLPLLQLVPLPPSLWHELPGAEFAVLTRSLIGAEQGWFPLTIDPQRTLIAFASLLPSLAVICLLPVREGVAQMALRVVVAFGLLNFLFGTLQIIGNQNYLLPYPLLEEGRLYGLFASHNTSGLFFVVALCALYGVKFGEQSDFRDRASAVLVGGLLVLGTVLTQSRSSNVLLILPLAAFALRWFAGRRADSRPNSWVYLVGGMTLLVGFSILAATNARIGQTVVRFEDLDDMRPEIWQDSWAALRAYFPLGSGMGSFDEVYQAFESLEHVNPGYARRAHNDYLELGIEAGLVGFVILAGWIAWALRAWWSGRRNSGPREVDASALALLVIAGQSVLDYPLRNQALLCLAALLIAVLAARSSIRLDGVRE